MAPKLFLFTAFAGAAACSAGAVRPRRACRSNDSAQTGQVISSQKGEIIAVRDVVIKAPSRHSGSVGPGSQIGAATAAAAVMGSPIAAASAVGSVIGGNGGRAADDRMGEEITIAIEGGKSVIVVQERRRAAVRGRRARGDSPGRQQLGVRRRDLARGARPSY